MKITARMFADCISEYLIESRIQEGFNIGYETVRLSLADQTCLEPGHAYVVDGKQLCKLTKIDSSCLIITTQAQMVNLPCAVLVCRGSLAEVYGAAMDAVVLYSNLEERLNDGLIKEREIEYFLEVCAGFFGNIIQVLDPALNVVAGVSPVYEGESDKPSAFLKHNTGFSAELVSEMAKRNLLRQTFEFKSAQYFKTPLFESGAIHLNLFEEDNYLGKLLIIEYNMPFTQGVADIVNIVGKYFKHIMIKRRSVVNANLFTAEYFVSEILSGRITDESFVSSQLSSIGWNIRDSYRILFVQINSQDLLNYYIHSLAKKLSSTLVFPLEDGLVVVVNMKDTNIEAVEKQIALLFQETRLYCGQSETFNDFLSAHSFFLQSKSAAHLGKKNLTQHLFYYGDYAIDHFISAVIAMKFENAFMHPAVNRIMEYDRENSTDYLNTLKVYLDSGTNQVLTAKKIHIHRNSLKYRLARLKEIANVDLDDRNQQLRLILSFRLSEYIENEE